ncbi:MAG: hypothetical protein QOE70_4625 [Chthoniobacter sp.]|nr:hypothetical protein [Chthoniobacter sp.]
MGFAVHVTKDDTFTVYSVSGELRNADGIDDKTDFTVEGIEELERRIIQFGNPHGVLITSERPLGGSKNFPALLKALFKPGIQIFYVSSQ